MEAAHHSTGGARFVVLNKIYGCYEAVEVGFVVAFEEVTARIGEDARFYDYDTFDFGFDYFHMIIDGAL